MPWSTHYKNGALNALRNVAFQKATVFVSAHSASPGDTGLNEISGGSPAYARKQLAFVAASAGVLATNGAVTLDIPAGTTVSHCGLWDALTNGNFLGYIDIVDEVYAAQGTMLINSGSPFDLNS